MESATIPQVNSLEKVRAVVQEIPRGAGDKADLAARMGLSARQLNYYLHAAHTLGLLELVGHHWQLTPLGDELLGTYPGSTQEAKVFRTGIRKSPMYHVVPWILDATAPTIDEIVEQLCAKTELSTDAAHRRAISLLAWHSYISVAAVITSLRLERFKSFRDAPLSVGGFTVLVGTNASGKSNVRDAFRFLHGIARGYTLAEIIGEKWIEGGVLQWKGIRGGTREATFDKSPTFALEVGFRVPDGAEDRDGTYRIEVEIDSDKPPRVIAERLVIAGRGQFVFDSHPKKNPPLQSDPLHLKVRLRKSSTVELISNRPALSQLLEHPDVKLRDVREHVKLALAAFRSMRFLDLSPDAMRTPSLPGQTILGDRGENLSSVLLAICADPKRRAALTEWVQELTPMDAKDFEFPADPAGRVLLTLVEEDGSRTSAYSASDGTLRFLAMIAALLGPEPADLYFFEELENGIHPTRLHLLLQLIEQQTAVQACQVIATTHSPQLLAFLNDESRHHAALVYRLKGQPASGIIRVLDIPHIKGVLEKQDLSRLLGSGWLENAMTLSAPEALA